VVICSSSARYVASSRTAAGDTASPSVAISASSASTTGCRFASASVSARTMARCATWSWRISAARNASTVRSRRLDGTLIG